MKTVDWAKYIVTRDESKGHALYSPSGMERTLGCPGSISLIKNSPKSEDSEASMKGVRAHTLLEYFLREGKAGMKTLSTRDAIEFKKHVQYSSEQHQAVLTAYNFVIEQYQEMHGTSGVKPKLLVERKVYLDDVVGADCNGTADIILYHEFGVLHVMDYKNGKTVVDATENVQMMTYALGFLEERGWDFKEVWLTILQPNALSGKPRTWKTTIKRLEKFKKSLIDGIKATKQQNAPFVEDGKWCFFCPGRLKCPLKQEKARDKLVSRFER